MEDPSHAGARARQVIRQPLELLEVRMFCPKCRAEYREGISVCATCHVGLVNSLSDSSEVEGTRIVTVYKTSNPAIIAFIKSAFKEDGLRYFVKGESSPFRDPVEIQVDEEDSERATQIVNLIDEDKFGQSRGATEADYDEESKQDRTAIHPGGRLQGTFIGFIIGALISGLGVFTYYYAEKHYTGVITPDGKKDSKPALFYTYEDGVIKKIEYDRNLDGKKDAFYLYKNGIVERGYSDDNFDGIEETSYFYDRYGLITRVEIDTNHDNKPEIIEYYSDGVLWKKIWHHESSRVIWKEATFSAGVMGEEYIDTDYDGKFDIKNVYNSSERPTSSVSLR
jgi:hypothetical protein